MHEQSITVGLDDQFYNIPSVVKGRKVNDDEAVAYAKRTNTLGQGFPDIATAVEAAKKRSARSTHGVATRPGRPLRGRR